MDDVLVIGAGPAGLLAAWVARQRGARVKVMAAGIGTTHISPGWIGVLNDEEGTRTSADERGLSLGGRLEEWIDAHPAHPYALAGVDALAGGLDALREVGQAAGLRYLGDLTPRPPLLTVKGGPSGEGGKSGSNFRLPTALGAVAQAAIVPESFAAGDLRQPGALLIAGPAGWRDFYPKLCAENLVRQGYAARAATFDLPEMHTSKFDATPTGLARLFDLADVRERVAAQLKPMLDGAARVGFPAVLGLPQPAAWRDLQERLGAPVFEIPTLPPSVPGIRLYNAFKASLTRAGVPILLDMTATSGTIADGRATGIVIPDVVRDRTYRAGTIILATGGLYGGGITSDYTGALNETIFGLPLQIPSGSLSDWFAPQFLGHEQHAIHAAGVRANSRMQPVDEAGRILAENVRVAGRLLAGYDPVAEGSTEGVWLATAWRAATA